MVEQLQPLETGTDLNQALRFHSRERRRSLAGVPELFRTLFLGIPTATIPAGSFPVRDVLVTFWTAVRITGATPAGLVFEFGDGTTAIAAWLNDTDIQFRAGDAAAADRGLATFDNTVSLPDTLELDLVFACRPGDGRVRIWGNGLEIARDNATGASEGAGAFTVGRLYEILTIGTTDFTLIGAESNTVGLLFDATGVGSGTGTARTRDLPTGWAADSAGAFAAAATGALPADVLQTGAPSDFDVIQPLSVFLSQVPRHFV